jgi:hypothetical protein
MNRTSFLVLFGTVALSVGGGACGGGASPDFAPQTAVSGNRTLGATNSNSNSQNSTSNSEFFAPNSNRLNADDAARPAQGATAPPSESCHDPLPESAKKASTEEPRAPKPATTRPAPERATNGDARVAVGAARGKFDAALAAGACDRLCDALRSLERSTDRLCSLETPVRGVPGGDEGRGENAAGCSDDRAVAARARAQVEARCGAAICPRTP